VPIAIFTTTAISCRHRFFAARALKIAVREAFSAKLLLGRPLKKLTIASTSGTGAAKGTGASRTNTFSSVYSGNPTQSPGKSAAGFTGLLDTKVN
tara:strand:- start:1118 stop:1402 length:285 start_codon:yes stop_codon:yes gene_type:complete